MSNAGVPGQHREGDGKVERPAAVAAVREGLEDVAAGRTRPAREALDELARKYKLRPAKDRLGRPPRPA